MRNSTLLRILLVLLACSLALNATAAAIGAVEANKLLAEGNSYFQQQKYDRARQIYQRLLNAGHSTPVVLYNLGTAEARTGQHAKAYAHLLAARSLDPRNKAIRANLDQVTSQLYPTEDRRPSESGWMQAVGYFRPSEWTLALFITLLLTSLCFGVSWTVKARWVRIVGSRSGWIFLVSTLVMLPAAAASIYYGWYIKKAIVAKSVEVRSGPDDRFAVIETLPSAASVRLTGRANNGYQGVRTPNGRIGYVPLIDLVEI